AQISGPPEWRTVDRMNSCNRAKKGSGNWQIDRSARPRSISRISIATGKKEIRCLIDIDALAIRFAWQSPPPNRFRRRKKVVNGRQPLDRSCGDTVMRNHLLWAIHPTKPRF